VRPEDVNRLFARLIELFDKPIAYNGAPAVWALLEWLCTG